MLLALLLASALVQEVPAEPRTQADGSQSWSILVQPCDSARTADEVVVCGQGAASSPRLPLPGERGPPDRPMPSNPDVSGMGALDAAAAPCATRSEGCTVGVDLFGGATALVRGVGKLIDPDSCCEEPGEATNPVALIKDVGGVFKRTFKKKPDKSRRVAIPLDDLPRPSRGEPVPSQP